MIELLKCAGKAFKVNATGLVQAAQGLEGGAPLLNPGHYNFMQSCTRSISAGDIRPFGNQYFRLAVFVHRCFVAHPVLVGGTHKRGKQRVSA